GGGGAAFGAVLEMSGGDGGQVGPQFAIDVGHQLFLFQGMTVSGVHLFPASSPSPGELSAGDLRTTDCPLTFNLGCMRSLSAMRARKSRERTVFTGSRNRSDISE